LITSTLKRDQSISVAKGIAIILMVLAHTRFCSYGAWFINMFHMPLFYFASGYCFKDKYLDEFRNFFVKRIKGIYYPYIKWCLIFLLLYVVFLRLHLIKGNEYTCSDYLSKLTRIFTLNSGFSELLGGYWFLESLFWASFISYFWLKIFRKPLLGVWIIVVIAILLLWKGWSFPYLSIWGKEFFASSFFLFGKCLKDEKFEFKVNVYIVLFSVLVIAIGTHYWAMGMNGNKMCWWKIVPFFVTAILGINLIMFLSRYLVQRYGTVFYVNFLADAGNNSLTILTWHFLLFKFVSLLIVAFFELNIESLSEFPVITEYAQMGFSLLFFMVGLMIPMSIVKCEKLKFLR